MANSLLDRQLSLVEYMTSGAAIFGDERQLSLIRALHGIDLGLLQAEARFAYAKRIEKIMSVLSKTFELLGSGQEAILREFVVDCPPMSISRLENARQFVAFLSARSTCADPPYLNDVAKCELACAEVDADLDGAEVEAGPDDRVPPQGAIRRGPGVVLVRCAYDVRPIFEPGSEQLIPVQRETHVVVALPPGEGHPQVFEVHPVIFELLAALNDWTDPAGIGIAGELAKLLPDLTEHGLVEVCR
jgi:hypothetical protein